MSEQDEKEFEDWAQTSHIRSKHWPWNELDLLASEEARIGFLESRRTLREKIKADPSIGKLEVEDWPESPDL